MSALQCPFCRKNGLVTIIRENEGAYLVATLDSNQQVMPGCFLIIPNDHVESLLELPANWQVHVSDLLASIPEVRDGVAFNLSYNQGRDAGQRVRHVHVWVILRQGEEGTLLYQRGMKALMDKILIT